MDRVEAVSHLERLRDAWLREDVDKYLSMFSEDFVFLANGVELTRGRLALENAVRRSYLRFEPVDWQFHEIAVHGPHILAEWTVSTAERKDGTPRSMRAMSIAEVTEGLTRWQREYRVPTEREPSWS